MESEPFYFSAQAEHPRNST